MIGSSIRHLYSWSRVGKGNKVEGTVLRGAVGKYTHSQIMLPFFAFRSAKSS